MKRHGKISGIGLAIAGLMWAQSAWTNWNIYRDSTGSGANPVGNSVVCPNDTLWLIVDTVGMGSAGITGWKWQADADWLVYCDGSDCPYVPGSFPSTGIANKQKLGVKIGRGRGICRLITYYANGDSLVSYKVVRKREGEASLQVRTPVCANSSVPISVVDVVGQVDSFIVDDGNVQRRNQRSFTINTPSGDGTIYITLTYYVCGHPTVRYYFVDYFTLPSTGPTPRVYPPSDQICLTGRRTLSVYLPAPPDSVVWRVNGSRVGVTHDITGNFVSFEWRPSQTGTYNIDYIAHYPCGTLTGSTQYIVSNPPPFSFTDVQLPPPSAPYCPGNTLYAVVRTNQASATVIIDIHNDGNIDYIGDQFSTAFLSIDRVPTEIKIMAVNPCAETLSTVESFDPPLTGNSNITIRIGYAPNQLICPGRPLRVSLDLPSFLRDSVRRVEWSWTGANWAPSSGLDTTVTIPSSGSSWTLRCRYRLSPNVPACINRIDILSSTFMSSGSPPSVWPEVLGRSICASTGGTVKLFIDPNKRSYADSIRYFLPGGTVRTLTPADTLVLSVPPNDPNYSMIYHQIYSCGIAGRLERSFLPVATQKPRFVTGPGIYGGVCKGDLITLYYRLDESIGVDSVVVYIPDHFRGKDVQVVPAPNTPGNYLLQIIAYNCVGTDTVQANLNVVDGPSAVFTVSPASACAGVPVTFQRTGSNAGIRYVLWDFGDGTTRYNNNLTVTHTYSAVGTYTVRATAYGESCVSTYETTITVYPTPILSDLNISVSGTTISYSVNAANYTQISWDFGDGQTASGVLSGTHTYASPGTYTVTVTIQTPCGTRQLSESIIITSLVQAPDGSPQWEVYPNPTPGTITIVPLSYSGRAAVQILDPTGRMVRRYQLENYPANIHLDLPAGMYTLQIISSQSVFTHKLVVE